MKLFLKFICAFSVLSLQVACESTPLIFQTSASSRSLGGEGGAGGEESNSDSLNLDGLDEVDESDDNEANLADPCQELTCSRGQTCAVESGVAACQNNSCDSLTCSPEQECIELEEGAYCKSLSCSTDLDCAASRYCEQTEALCRDDLCSPGERSCSADGESDGEGGSEIYLCAPNGSGFVEETECGSPGAFESSCRLSGAEIIGCSCEADWDCPGFQECDGSVCTGSLEPPSCRLPPADIDTALPSKEIIWGTAPNELRDGRLRNLNGSDVEADPSPWSDFAQATQTPIVADLDGDEIPEILFLTFDKDNGVNDDAVLRVIHGGGSKKGRDYFAVCGDHRYFEGEYYPVSDFSAEPTPLPGVPTCDSAAADLDSAATIAVGDLNYDGTPEVVVYGEDPTEANDGFNSKSGRIYIFDNRGRQLLKSEQYTFKNLSGSGANPGISLANVVSQALLPSPPSPEEGEGSDESDESFNAAAREHAEIVIGQDLFLVDETAGVWSIRERFSGADGIGLNGQGPFNCIADLIPNRPGMEIVAGSSIYGIPLADDALALNTTSNFLVTLNAPSAETYPDGFCAIADVWGEATDAVPSPANPLDEKAEIVLISAGVLSIYSLAVSEPQTPEQEWQVALTELTSANALTRVLPGAGGGGVPNIDDFDGDGFPEVGTAGKEGYIVFDLQTPTAPGGACVEWSEFADAKDQSKERSPPADTCRKNADCNADPNSNTWTFACNASANVGEGACVCLHNSWVSQTQDASSRVTGSSVFDFNGDGAAEVIYNDECHFRMYSGLDGREIFIEESEGRTRTEYPIVADVDNDGNAEIVFATSTESGFCTAKAQSLECLTDAECPSGDKVNGQKCRGAGGAEVAEDVDKWCQVVSRESFNAGIEVWGDLTDQWVSARRIWNQFSYHVTNIRENGGIPRVEPNSWQPLGARLYNTYRSQPRAFGSAPDLVVKGLQVIAPGSCGDASGIVIGAEIRNEGDLRAAEIPVTIKGTWEGAGVTEELLNSEGEPLSFIIVESLAPGARRNIQVTYESGSNTLPGFPDSVELIIDEPNESGQEVVRECKENNNQANALVMAAPALPDLRLTLDDPAPTCPPPVKGTVYNSSDIVAENVIVQISAGRSLAGASIIGSFSIGDVPAGGSVAFEETRGSVEVPIRSPVRLYGEVDADNEINECNENNNSTGPTALTSCNQIN